jgi:N-dimethylarginine dimethylaminohydrolase
MRESSVVLGFPEYGRLRRVLMHAPGDELNLIKPASYHKYLFEDAIDAVEFRRQHEELVETLRGEGVDVVLLESLLHSSPLFGLTEKSPNLVYIRDTNTVTLQGNIGMRMRSPARRQEPRIVATALRRLDLGRLMEIKPPGTMEGGDLIFLDQDTLLVGIGNRTNWAGLRQLQERTRGQGLRTLIAVRLPPWVTHLDGTMMIIDQDLAIVHREALNKPAMVFEEGEPPKQRNPFSVLRNCGFRLVEVTAYERQRRATNVITLGHKKLVGYSGNIRVRNMLTKEGVDFIEADGSELLRGGGGPRCMTAPLERESCQSRDQPRPSDHGES